MTPVFEKVAADDSVMVEIATAFETGALVLSIVIKVAVALVGEVFVIPVKFWAALFVRVDVALAVKAAHLTLTRARVGGQAARSALPAKV